MIWFKALRLVETISLLYDCHFYANYLDTKVVDQVGLSVCDFRI